MSRNVHEYFLKYWPWRSERVHEHSPQQGLATWHCYNYPDSLDDRIEPGGFLCTILFLIDGMHLFIYFSRKKSHD